MNEEIKKELLKRINSNISTYGNTKPHLGNDGINQVMDFITTNYVERAKVKELPRIMYDITDADESFIAGYNNANLAWRLAIEELLTTKEIL